MFGWGLALHVCTGIPLHGGDAAFGVVTWAKIGLHSADETIGFDCYEYPVRLGNRLGRSPAHRGLSWNGGATQAGR